MNPWVGFAILLGLFLACDAVMVGLHHWEQSTDRRAVEAPPGGGTPAASGPASRPVTSAGHQTTEVTGDQPHRRSEMAVNWLRTVGGSRG